MPVVVLAMLAVTAVTAVGARDGEFTCSASAFRINAEGGDPAFEPITANAANDPCVAEEDAVVAPTTLGNPATGGAIVEAVHVQTTRTGGENPAAGDGATSHAEVADATLSGAPGAINVEAAESNAAVTCVAGAGGRLEPQFTSDSRVVGLTVTQAGSEPEVIALPPDDEHVHIPVEGAPIVLHLNHSETETTPEGSVRTQRAVWLESPLGDIVVAEAVADYTGNPCRQPGGTIVIEKNTIPDGPQDFTFTGTAPIGEFQLDDDNNDAGPGPETPGDDSLPRARSFEVPAGNHSVTEAAAAGYNVSDIDCDDANSTESPGTRTANIVVEPGETVTCTFTNQQTAPTGGQITIVKDADPDAPQDFSFSGTLGQFVLDDDNDPTRPNQRDFGQLANGDYTVTEDALPAGWSLTGIVCADPTNNSAVNTGSRTATIRVDNAETIRCEFQNRGPASCPPGSQPNQDGDCVITETQCPDGSTRNAQNECVVTDARCPENSTTNERGECVARGECPDGAVRNAEGQCVVGRAECPPGSVPNQQGQCVLTETNCPPGSTRNERGECIERTTPFDPVPIPDIPGGPASPCSRPGFGAQVGIIGTSGRDRITGTNQSDRIFAFNGSDRVSGGRGNDCVEGGGGNDNLDGSNGTDYLLGGSGRDISNGGTGRDLLVGESGNDKLSGGSGNDRLSGGSGRDRLSGGLGNDRLDGGADRDYIDGGNGLDTVRAGAGNDAVNVATAGAGRDVVDCGPGRDVVRAGSEDRLRNCERVLIVRTRR